MPTPPDLDAHLARIDRDGYTIVEDAIDQRFLDQLQTDLLRLVAVLGIGPANNLFEGLRTGRLSTPLCHGKLYEQVPVHEQVLPIVERVLDRGCLVSSLSSISIGPGETPQPGHAEDMLIPLPRP